MATAENTSKLGDRLAVVDALRGFALLGIAVAHFGEEYLGFWPPEGYVNERFPFDAIAPLFVAILTFGKFFTIFSFLFGLGFAIQLQNSAKRATPFTGRFLRRLLILFSFGLVHSLFYTGDILGIYAMLGVLLLPARHLPDKWLLAGGLLLVLNVPTHCKLIWTWCNPPVAEVLERERAAVEEFKNHARDHFEVRRRGTLQQVVAFNWRHGFTDRMGFQISSGRLFITLGLFLLGLWAGRNGLLAATPANRRLFKWLLAAGAVMTALATPVAFSIPPSLDPVMTNAALQATIAFDYHQAGLSLVYFAGFALLFWASPEAWLQRLVPVGRMGLSVYLTQSIVGVTYYYSCGLGMLGQLGATLAVSSGILVFAIQVWLAGLWMRRFQYGPFEWLWRSLTEGRLQTFRHRHAG